MATKHAFAFNDTFPISEGHTLVIPIRHIASIYDLSEEEQTNLWSAGGQGFVQDLVEKLHPRRLPISGSMTVPQRGRQLTMHTSMIIPRRNGDVADPRAVASAGSFLKKAPYWDRKP